MIHKTTNRGNQRLHIAISWREIYIAFCNSQSHRVREVASVVSTDSRGPSLRTLNAMKSEFSECCAARHELGETLAAIDSRALEDLAEHLARSVGDWQNVVERFEIASTGRLERRVASKVLVECLFDDVLMPEASRVLSAALALAIEQQ